MSKVGTSQGRTPFKHALINTILGQTIGVCARNHIEVGCARRWHVDDLCAGNGLDSAESGTSSPKLIRHHLEHKYGGWMIRSAGGHATATLWEKNGASFESLKQGYGDSLDIRLRNADAMAFAWPPDDLAVRVVIADPNNVHQLPIRSDFYDGHMPRFGSVLFTLGCNVGGLLRLPLEHRERWLEVAHIGDIMRRNHEAVLIQLCGDAARWSYLLVYPRKWVPALVKSVSRQAALHWPAGVDVTLHSDGQARWRDAFETMMLTRSEYADKPQNRLDLLGDRDDARNA